jgi:hypothetical protein
MRENLPFKNKTELIVKTDEFLGFQDKISFQEDTKMWVVEILIHSSSYGVLNKSLIDIALKDRYNASKLCTSRCVKEISDTGFMPGKIFKLQLYITPEYFSELRTIISNEIQTKITNIKKNLEGMTKENTMYYSLTMENAMKDINYYLSQLD